MDFGSIRIQIRIFVCSAAFLVSSSTALFLASRTASAAVLIEEGGRQPSQEAPVPDPLDPFVPSDATSQSEFQSPMQAQQGISTITSWPSAGDLRAMRRLGVGAVVAGRTGLWGVDVELNFTPAYSFIGSFGGGPGYQSFALNWKTLFAGTTFAPFVGVGFSRWYNSVEREDGVGTTSPTVLGSRFLSDEQKRTGVFGKSFLVPSAGLQYFQLQGPYAGASFFVEVLLLADLDTFVSAPTGGVGVLYYF